MYLGPSLEEGPLPGGEVIGQGWALEDIRREGWGGSPKNPHAVGWPRISSAHTKDSNRSLRLALLNFPLQSSSFRLFHAGKHPPPHSGLVRLPHPVLRSHVRGREQGREGPAVRQGLRSLDLCAWHITPVLFWGKGLTSLS